MQAQITPVHVNVQTITSAQSLTCVQALLKAGIGCIAYLRNLLPMDNFSEAHLVSESNGMQSSGSFSTDGGEGSRNTSSIRMMNINRGFTNEGDRIMDYLELGIFDAIEKQYLQSFIFAIYLDSKDPNNIVEAYTFNFEYKKLPGTNVTVPIMSMGDQLSNMSLGSSRRRDPVADAMKQGKMPTLGEVKKSLKAMIRTLLMAIGNMESLPKCRYGNFKLFFNEDTPDSYQPQHFQVGDPEKNRWFFTTHKLGEAPEVNDIGHFKAGWHGVKLKVASVSSYLPSISEDNNATFTGIMSHPAPKLTPIEEAKLRIEDAELQRKDAMARKIAWNADTDADADADAEGEEVEDEGIVLRRFGCDTPLVPIGVRADNGTIQPIEIEINRPELMYQGMSERTPARVGEINGPMPGYALEQTQIIPATQEIDMASLTPISRRPVSSLSLPPSDMVELTESALSTQQIDTQMLMNMEALSNGAIAVDAEMLDMETQVPVAHPPIRVADPIESFDTQESIGDNIPSNSTFAATTHNNDEGSEGELDCDCGFNIKDSSLLCEGGCSRWHHVWCTGFHKVGDRRLPKQFHCFGCRLRRRNDWDLILADSADIISRYKDLAIFRRAIKICEVRRPKTLSQFKQELGCDTALAGQLLTRLEKEGFMATETLEVDDIGIVTTRKKTQPKSKQKKPQKVLQKTVWGFVWPSKRTTAYADYFNPDPEVENRLIGLSNFFVGNTRAVVANGGHPRLTATTRGVYEDNSISQTQDETQRITSLAFTSNAATRSLKRKAEGAASGQNKKIKVFVGEGVDLCD
ncbi:HORMA domain-containing protein [Hygrophoropsis aurantiaca]|uniref:HORMA domain-containing protein n=1 Tax=Hygrophoropsis aurantiaca TaxID=72124 RepID=A0ACB8A6R4_9AGAM|nr:HORMA domain-containing protein [Hygrophoropsis aurantiaca]